MARALALARRHHRLRRGARAGRGLCAAGLPPRSRWPTRRRCRARAREAWLAWYASTPDAPCIAICSTSQGDAVCKGCGRSFDEVQHWTELQPGARSARSGAASRMEGTAWRFNRYAERARWPPAPTIRTRRPSPRPADRLTAGRPSALRPAGDRGTPPAAHPARASVARAIAPLAWPVFVGQVVGAGLRHRRHAARGARTRQPTWRRWRSARRPTSRSSSASWAWCWRSRPSSASCYGARPPRARPGASCTRRCGWRWRWRLLGSTLLAVPGSPSWPWRRPAPEVAGKVRGYLLALAFALPASLLFTVYRGFNTAVSRPKAVMALQLGGLALKVPLSAALVFGLPALGAAGAGRAWAAASPPPSRCGRRLLAAGVAAAPRPVLRALRAAAAAACDRPTGAPCGAQLQARRADGRWRS
ncbi:MAG: DUF1289 domain-containing protein [Comamonadaceae bacterium]|nr:DUF1289 domain-containing protein [Comamonadaceae bacterium]